jgi:magnesium-transporting ATPase (P-type)
MMNLLIAIAAGCASALMFASIISGALFSLVLVYLSPLPLMVAALGWGPASALVGGMGAGVVLALSFNLMYGLGYVLTVAAPAYWLGHISLLAQPATASAAPRSEDAALDWYPIGRVLLWTALISALIMIFALMMTGDSGGDITAKLRDQALQALNAVNRAGVEIENKERVASLMARALPLVAVGTTTLMYLLNLWLAGRIAQTSHRLRRPWPDLHKTELPQSAIVVLAATLLLSFAGGLVALIAQIFGAALLTAYTLVGFAVLHHLTRFASGRLWWRLTAYGTIVMFIWPLLLMPIVGLLDASFGLRRRFGSASGPPTPST